jgi:hypothetical protein
VGRKNRDSLPWAWIKVMACLQAPAFYHPADPRPNLSKALINWKMVTLNFSAHPPNQTHGYYGTVALMIPE